LKLKGYITRDQIRFMWYLIPRIIQKARDYNMKMIMEQEVAYLLMVMVMILVNIIDIFNA